MERCAGIDIGKRFLVCCVMTGAAHEEPRSETRRFDTTVPGLKRLRNWLNDAQVIGKVQAFRKDHKPPKATLICVRLWCSMHGRQLVSATLSFGPAFND